MSDLTDNNLTINPGTGGAVVATDYVDSSHFQVMKLAFGNSADAVRVESGMGLPVEVQGSINAVITSINSGVGVDVRNNIGVYGVAGATLVGVTATDLDIRSLTFGSDSISVLNTVGVTATDLDIRSLTFTTDSVSVLNTVGVTATDLDIRSLTFGSDSVSVLNNVSVVAGGSGTFEGGLAGFNFFGLDTRLLRASKKADAISTPAVLGAELLINPSVEDTVRVVGLSGAYPVDVVPMGLTNIANRTTRVPLHVTDSGSLMVELAAGSISVTADVSGLGSISVGDLTIAGISLDYPAGLSNVLPVCGYTGSDTIPIAVTASAFDIRALTSAKDSIAATVSGNVGVTGDVRDQINKLDFVRIDATTEALLVKDSGLTTVATSIGNLSNTTSDIKTNLAAVTNANNQLKVSIEAIAQPTGGTSGNIVNSNTSTAIQFPSFALQSGVHLKASPNNQGTIFVGFAGTNTITGFPLLNGDQIFIETNNLNKIFFASSTANQTLHFCGT